MTPDQARAALATAVAASWSAARPLDGFALENEGGIALPDVGNYAYFEIRIPSSNQATVGEQGARMFERRGTVAIKLWAPAGAGTAEMDAMISACRGFLESRAIGSPADGESVDMFGLEEVMRWVDGRWYQALCRVPFRVFETK